MALCESPSVRCPGRETFLINDSYGTRGSVDTGQKPLGRISKVINTHPGHLCAAQSIIAWHASPVTSEKMGVGIGTWRVVISVRRANRGKL